MMFAQLDEKLHSAHPLTALDFLIEQALAERNYGRVFEARLMKKRYELGLPLLETESPNHEAYQQAMVEIAREIGHLYLADGFPERAWPYFRAIGDPQPLFEAIDRIEPAEQGLEALTAIAFNEGVHPVKGLEFIIFQHGMCRALTAFGMTPVPRDRDKCIALLVHYIHAEVVTRLSQAIEAHEGREPLSGSLPDLIQDRDWLFGEWDYYIDTSHLLTVLPYTLEVADPAVLRQVAGLCAYGKKLAPQFQAQGNAPFEDQFLGYGHYALAQLASVASEQEKHLAWFRAQLDPDPDSDNDTPARHLARLLIACGRHTEALDTIVEHVFEDEPGISVPSALQLCYDTKNYSRLSEIAHNREDFLSYAAAGIEANDRQPQCRSPRPE